MSLVSFGLGNVSQRVGRVENGTHRTLLSAADESISRSSEKSGARKSQSYYIEKDYRRRFKPTFMADKVSESDIREIK